MGHYYTQQGEPRHFVPVKSRPGDLRPTTIRDAKKEGWLPSVTTVLNVLDKAALVNWKVDQHIRQAYELILSGDVSYENAPAYDEYLSKVKRLTEMEMDKAPAAGTDIHASIEAYLLGEKYPPEHESLLQKIDDLLIQKTDIHFRNYWPEKRFAHEDGYAGMIDLVVGDAWVIDFKTKQTADKFKPGKMAYPDHSRQLAAYRHGIKIPSAQCANLFICIETGDLDFHLHTEADLQRGLDTFMDALHIWQRENYDTRFKREAASPPALFDNEYDALKEAIAPSLFDDAVNEITRLQAENERLEILLNPRHWTKEMSDAWHRSIPDIQKAFEALQDTDNG